MGQYPYECCPIAVFLYEKRDGISSDCHPFVLWITDDYLLRETFVTPYFVPSLTLTT